MKTKQFSYRRLHLPAKKIILVITGIFIVLLILVKYQSTSKSNTENSSKKFDLSTTNINNWHPYHNTKFNFTIKLPPELSAHTTYPDSSQDTSVTGQESFLGLYWDTDSEPYLLPTITLDIKSKLADTSLKKHILEKYGIVGNKIPASQKEYYMFAETTFDVLEFSEVKLGNNNFWYLSIVPIDDVDDEYDNRFGAGEYLFLELDSEIVLMLTASTEFNFDPYIPVLKEIGKSLERN